MIWLFIALIVLTGCADMYEGLYRSAARVKNPKQQVISYGPFNGGLVTAREAERCARNECPELFNMVLETNELARTRDGVSLVCGTADGPISCVRDVKVDGAYHTVIGADGSSGSVAFHDGFLYLQDSTGLEAFHNDTELYGIPRFVGFVDFLMIFDGGMLKYWDGQPWDTGITYEIIRGVYDDGVGADAYLLDNRGYPGIKLPEQHIGVVLGDGGAQTRVAEKFTVPDIDNASSQIHIGLPTVTVALCRVGSGYTGTETPVRIKIINLVGAVEADYAESDLVNPSDLPQVVTAGGADPADYQEYTYTFKEADLTTTPTTPNTQGMRSLNPEYYVSVEFSGGDATNYVYVHGYYVDYFDVPGTLYTSGGGSFTLSTTKTGVFSERRSVAPNAVDGLVHSNRLFVIEGEAGTNPDRLWYSGAGNPFDWSSPNSGGYIDTGKPIGGIASFYGEVWIFGTSKEPSLRRLTGKQPVDYAIEDTMQQVAGNYKSLVTTPDDVFFLHPAGMDSVRVMQEYGDVRAISQTDAIKNLIAEHYDTDAVAGYDPDSGVVMLKLNDSTDSIYVIHTRLKRARQMGDIVYQVSPIAEWVLNLPQEGGNDQAPSAFGHGDGCAYIGTDEGMIYKLDNTVVTDAGQDADYRLRTAYMSSRFGEMNARRVNFDIFGNNGGSFRLNFYTNHSTTVLFYAESALPTNLAPTDPDDPSGGDAFELNFDRLNVNFPFRSLMMEINNITLNGHNPIYIGAVSVMGYNKGNL